MLFGFGAGALLAHEARRPLARNQEPLTSRYFAAAAIWGGAVLAPAGLVLYAQYPDWMLMYLANPAHLSPFLVYPFLIAAYFSSPLAGFFVMCTVLERERPRRLVRAVTWAVVLGLALVVGFGARRLVNVAYYDAYHAGLDGLSLFRSSLFLALLPCGVAVLGIFGFVLHAVRRHAEIVERPPAAAS